jgi:hypothetical protein
LAKERVHLHGSSEQPFSLSNPGGRRQSSREILRDFINAALGLPALAEKNGIHVKTPHRIFGPAGNPTAANLFNIIACLREHEGLRLPVAA